MLSDDERGRKFWEKKTRDQRPAISERAAAGGEEAGKFRTLRSFGDPAADNVDGMRVCGDTYARY
jgi:hypothetical protein